MVIRELALHHVYHLGLNLGNTYTFLCQHRKKKTTEVNSKFFALAQRDKEVAKSLKKVNWKLNFSSFQS